LKWWVKLLSDVESPKMETLLKKPDFRVILTESSWIPDLVGLPLVPNRGCRIAHIAGMELDAGCADQGTSAADLKPRSLQHLGPANALGGLDLSRARTALTGYFVITVSRCRF
jgi:hypothetical protein